MAEMSGTAMFVSAVVIPALIVAVIWIGGSWYWRKIGFPGYGEVVRRLLR